MGHLEMGRGCRSWRLTYQLLAALSFRSPAATHGAPAPPFPSVLSNIASAVSHLSQTYSWIPSPL